MASWPRIAVHNAARCRAALRRSTVPVRPRSVTAPGNSAGEASTAGPTGSSAGVAIRIPPLEFFAVFAEEFVQIGVADQAGEAVELALLGDLRCRLDEGVHRHPSERPADADAPHAHAGEVVHREAERAHVEKVDRLAARRLHGGLDVLAGSDARR